MIKYLLKCNDCDQEFESWFSTSNEYDRLLKLKLLNCQSCESINVEKSLMSPNLLNTKKKENLKEIKKYRDVQKKLSGVRGLPESPTVGSHMATLTHAKLELQRS